MKTELDMICDTVRHIHEVAGFMEEMIGKLRKRAAIHDLSKLAEPEFSIFVSTREEFKKVNFGTPEYDAVEKKARVAVNHHHAHNSHHTAYYQNGLDDMTLFDLVEMLADWKAANRRSEGLEFITSMHRAFDRYNFSEQLQKIFINTAHELGW